MSLKYSISALALASALLASASAFAQLDLSLGEEDGINVGVDLDTDDSTGIGVDVGVDSEGETVGVDLDARADSEGDNLVDADMGVGVGGNDSLVGVDADARVLDNVNEGPLVDLNADTTVGGPDALMDANVNLGEATGGLINMNGAEQSGILLSLISQSNVAGLDLDAVTDDRQIIIVEVSDLLSQDALTNIELALFEGDTAGVEDTRAAVSASAALSSVLEGNGVAVDDVIAVDLGTEGETYVYVLADRAHGTNASADADLMIAQDGTLVGTDIGLLPGADDAVNGVGADASLAGSSNGGVNADANVVSDDQDLVDLDVNLLEDEAVDAQIDILSGATGDDGFQADTDADLGDQQVSRLSLNMLAEDLLSGDLVVLPDSIDGAGNSEDTSISGNDNGAGDGAGSGISGAHEPNDAAGIDGEAINSAAEAPDLGISVAGSAAVSILACPADIRGFLEGTATGAEIHQASEAEVVLITGCGGQNLFDTAGFDRLREVVSALPHTREAIEASPVEAGDVVSATVSGDVVTIYALQ